MRNIRSLARVLGECITATSQFSPCLPVLSRRLRVCNDYPCEIKATPGLRFEAETYHDLVTAWIIFCRVEYSPRVDSKLIVDLGANIGLFSLWASQHAPAARIWAVEPFPRCVARLAENIQRNALEDRIQVIQKAIAQAAGSRAMRATGPTQSNGLQPLGTAATKEMVTVEAIPLNDLLLSIIESSGQSTIDFLKIDVEGGEHEFLQADGLEALECVEAIGIEYHPNGSKDRLFSVLAGHGFQLIDDVAAHENSGVAHFRRRR